MNMAEMSEQENILTLEEQGEVRDYIRWINGGDEPDWTHVSNWLARCGENRKRIVDLEQQLRELSYFTDPHAKGALGRWLTVDEIMKELSRMMQDLDGEVEDLEIQLAKVKLHNTTLLEIAVELQNTLMFAKRRGYDADIGHWQMADVEQFVSQVLCLEPLLETAVAVGLIKNEE